VSALALTAAIAASFNLACPVAFVQQIGDLPPSKANYAKELRIDLQTNRWCDGKCLETKPISSVTDLELVLQSEAQPDIDAYDSITVNRESGAFSSHHRINDVSYDETGVCKPRPFSGFPARRF
jgi:hypothetical protein